MPGRHDNLRLVYADRDFVTGRFDCGGEPQHEMRWRVGEFRSELDLIVAGDTAASIERQTRDSKQARARGSGVPEPLGLRRAARVYAAFRDVLPLLPRSEVLGHPPRVRHRCRWQRAAVGTMARGEGPSYDASSPDRCVPKR